MGIFPPDHKHLADALALAWEKLSSKDPLHVARRASVERKGDGFQFRFLSDFLRVEVLSRRVLADEGAVSSRVAILALHYLVQADGAPLEDKLAGFAELPGGASYLGPFNARVVERIARKFGNDPTAFLKCGMDLGGRRTDFGDAGMIFPLFPKVPVTVALWRGDEEMPPGASVSFDRSVTHYLSTEDVVVACEELVNRLSEIKKILAL